MSEASLQVVGGSGDMFNRIASKYDRMNRLISFGLDRGWRKALVAGLALPANARALDVATGTADVAMDILKHHPDCTIVGLDPSEGMLGVGQTKIDKAGVADRITLTTGDAQEMPFEDNHFDGACISFGIRNVPDRVKGLSEMARVTRPGGKIVVLELSEPRGSLLSPFARFHVHHVVPLLGALLSGAWEYRYLQESIAAFPAPSEFVHLMNEAGVTDVDARPLFQRVAHLYVGTVR